MGFSALCFAFICAAQNTWAGSNTTESLENDVLGSSSTEESAPIDTEVPDVKEAAPEKANEKDLSNIEEAVRGPKTIPNDQILVVQRRYIHKDGASEFTPVFVGLQPADSFRKQVEWGFSYAYHLNEEWAIEAVHMSFIANFQTGLNDTIRSSVGLETDRVEPVWSAASSLQWTPFHAKAATDSEIHHFEGFLLAGGGVTKLETDMCGMGMWGLGFRVYLSKYSLLKAELRDYMDFKSTGLDQRFNLLAGASILWGGS